MSHVFTVAATGTEVMRLDASGNLSIGNSTSRGGPFGAAGLVTAPRGVVTDLDRINMADMTSEIFEAKIEDLLNLWVARFGNEWVDLDAIESDQTFTRIYKRLRQTGQLEQHYLTDRACFVCRKPQ